MATFNVQVLSIDNDYHSCCLAITTEKYRFLIECGEGTQRLAVEHKLRFGKIVAVFLTSAEITSVGGLPGMLLTLDDSGVSSPNIIGPPAVVDFMQSTGYFMRTLGNYHSITDSSSAVPINFEELVMTPILLSSNWNSSFRTLEKVCYIGETPLIPGKFDLQKATELKIPKGPLYGKLKNGFSITLENGTTISPDQVLGESTPPFYFAVIPRLHDDSAVVDSISQIADLSCWKM
jgi:ribonuclease Z